MSFFVENVQFHGMAWRKETKIVNKFKKTAHYT